MILQIVLPVAIGEFGSKFEDKLDAETMHDLVAYMGCRGAADDGAHSPITQWFWW